MKSRINYANPYLHDLIEGLREPGLAAQHVSELIGSEINGPYQRHVYAELTLQANKARTGRELHLAVAQYASDGDRPAARTWRAAIDPNSDHAVDQYREAAKNLGAIAEDIKAFEEKFELMLEAGRQCGGPMADTTDRHFHYEEPYEEVPAGDGKPGYGAYATWSNYDMAREVVRENKYLRATDLSNSYREYDEIEVQVHGPKDKRYFYADFIAQPNAARTALESYLAVSHRSDDQDGPYPNCRAIVLIDPRSETLREDFHAAARQLGITPSFAEAYEGRFVRLAGAVTAIGFEIGSVSNPNWNPESEPGFDLAIFREHVAAGCTD